jgi:hypothetical protein
VRPEVALGAQHHETGGDLMAARATATAATNLIDDVAARGVAP